MLVELLRSLVSAESIAVSAEDNAFWSVEAIVPELTSVFNSCCSNCSGDR